MFGRFLDVGLFCAFVTCRSDNDPARSGHTVQHSRKETIFLVEIGMIALTERDYTRFPLPTGIVEAVFHSQGINGCRVFVDIGRIDILNVIRDGITHQTDITLKGHAPVLGVIATANGNTRGMCTMCLGRCIGGLSTSQYLCLPDIITANGQQTANGILRQLVPESPNAVLTTRCIIESRMLQVKTDIFNTNDDPSPRIGGVVVGGFIDGKGVDYQSRRIHQCTGTAISLNTTHSMFCRQCLHFLQWNTRNHDILPLGIFPATILPENIIGLFFFYSDKGCDAASPLSTINTACQWQTTVLCHRLSHIARQFPLAGMLSIRHQHQSHKN